MADLPHAHPFRLVEPRGEGAPHGGPLVTPSLGASLPRQAGRSAWRGYPLALAIEAMAQSVLAAPPPELAGGRSSGGKAHLAGIEQAKLLAAILPGDRLETHAEVAGRFGPAAKVRCRLERDGDPVAEATLLLTLAG